MVELVVFILLAVYMPWLLIAVLALILVGAIIEGFGNG